MGERKTVIVHTQGFDLEVDPEILSKELKDAQKRARDNNLRPGEVRQTVNGSTSYEMTATQSAIYEQMALKKVD